MEKQNSLAARLERYRATLLKPGGPSEEERAELDAWLEESGRLLDNQGLAALSGRELQDD